jgi:hypothetical protein
VDPSPRAVVRLMSSRLRSPWVPWLIWGITGVVWATMMGLIALPRSVPSEGLLVLPRATGSLLVMSTATVGALVASRRPTIPIGWIFCEVALLWCGGALATEYAIYALVEEPRSLPAGGLAAWLASWLMVPPALLLIFVLLLFPDGRLPSRRWRPIGWLAVVGIALTALGRAFAPGPPDTTIFAAPPNPFAFEDVPGIGSVESIGLSLTFACGVVGVISLLLRMRRARGAE